MGEDNYFDFGNEPTKTTKKKPRLRKIKRGKKKLREKINPHPNQKERMKQRSPKAIKY